MDKRFKIALLIIVVGVLLGVIALAPVQLGGLGRLDLLSYWASAHLLLNGGDVYDADTVVALSVAVDPARQSIVPAWNPPWLMVALMPMAALPFDVAARLWLVFNLVTINGLMWLVWHWLARSRPPIWLPLVGLGFYAALVMISIGQIVIIILLGVMTCLAALRSGRDGLAGAALILALGKPQLVYIVVPLILIWAARQRRWRVWWGLGAAWLVTLLVATLLAPNWLRGYLYAVTQHDFFMHLSATLGGWVKAYTGSDGLRYTGVLGLMLIPWLLRLIERRDLLTGLNAALLISLPLAPYGWSFDQVMLLPAIVQLVCWLTDAERGLRRAGGLILVAIYLAAFGMKIWGAGDFMFVWVPIALGGLYALVYRARFAQPHVARLKTGEL